MSKSSETTEPKSRGWLRIGRYGIAIVIVVSAFAAIGVMLGMQTYLVNSALDQMNKNRNMNATQAEEFRKNFEELHQSNLTLFNILLPIFGAWVGAVVAFYFGAENLMKAQETIAKLASPAEILSGITVAQLLKDYPTATDIDSAEIKHTIKTIMDKFAVAPQWPLLIVNEQQKSLGMLYRADLLEALLKGKLTPEDSRKLEEIIADAKIGIKDFITQKQWTVDGVKNFAELKLNHSLLEAHIRMHAISDHPAVRGVVIESEKVIAIIDHEMIASKVKGTVFR